MSNTVTVSATPGALVSGEGVAYELPHAGLGSRMLAGIIDLVIEIFGLSIIATLSAEALSGSDVDTSIAVGLVELVLAVAAYPIVCEWLTRGRTVGKLCLGLRVVRDDGGPITFRQALVRGICGLVLEKPGVLLPLVGPAIGCAAIAFTPDEKRVGDIMAGTFVLNERGGPQYSALSRVFYLPDGLSAWAGHLDLNRLDDTLALGVRQFVLRAAEMKPGAQVALGEELRRRVLAVTAPAPPPGVPTPILLMAVLAERRRRTDAALAAAQSTVAPVPPVGLSKAAGAAASRPDAFAAPG